ncbi:hypothetical protein CKAH01_07206 [Colletotrichum kahawae]|uniref:Uncharacterized protein n=1 Tax=Colletotrichum kahawae TaxID=34407 RepID=A0AAE0D245_COLKA|nr:hypothetical protein CKAH01_07206 [Colletotrichum kahawae]
MLLLPWRRCTVSTPAEGRTRCWGSAGGEALLLVGRWLAIFFSGGGALFIFVHLPLAQHAPLAFLEGTHRRGPPNCVPKSQLLGERDGQAHRHRGSG